MHVSCSIDFGSATPLSPHARAVFLAVHPSLPPPPLPSFPPSSVDLLCSCPFFPPPLPPSPSPSPDASPSPAVWSGRRGSHSPPPPAAALAALISIFTRFPAYRVDIIKAPSQRRAHLLSSPFYTFPSLFLSFCVSLSLALTPPPSLPPSRSLSGDLKGSLFESAEWLGFAFFLFFIPMTETCWRLPILDKRVGLF